VAYEDRALEVEELVYQTQKGDRDTEHSENVLELVEERDLAPQGQRALRGHLLVVLDLLMGRSLVRREDLLYSWLATSNIFSVFERPIFEVLAHFLGSRVSLLSVAPQLR